MRRLGIALLALPLVGGLFAAEVAHRLSPRAEEGPDVLFIVERGDPLATVARKLEDADLVRDARAVVWLARLRGLSAKLRAGEYLLSATLTPGEMLLQISEGRVITYEVSLPEGFTARQIGERLAARELADAAEFAAAVHDPEL
ncbi:MAG TPA: endolytic transglycosylase MltG, partial [Myxococcota bacterium]